MNKQKKKGSDFERDVVNILNKNIKKSAWNRIPTSGAIGTALDIAGLQGDVYGKVNGIPREIRGECKTGYNTSKESKQMALRKEWLDKIAEEAKKSFGIPVLFGKFENVHSGVKIFAVMDIEVFIFLMNRINELKDKFDDLYKEVEEGNE